MKTTRDLRIKSIYPLTSPNELLRDIPLSEMASDTVSDARSGIIHALENKDDRLVVVVGPCSIHDPISALDYARRLQAVIPDFNKQLILIMRVYFEKPRTTVGWKGLINDPHLDGSFDIRQGLVIARKLLADINDLGVPAGCEFLDTIIPQYLSDLCAWGAIGARTTESQIHRELASGLSMPVGFKNGTSGNVDIAIDAIKACSIPHHFLGVTPDGTAAIVSTDGNPDAHLILRGGQSETNYDANAVESAVSLLKKAHLPSKLMIDCSHGNSKKDYKNQTLVIDSICEQLSHGEQSIMGVMIESHLVAGKQNADNKRKDELVYGQSITDACVDWDETVVLLNKLNAAVLARRQGMHRSFG